MQCEKETWEEEEEAEEEEGEGGGGEEEEEGGGEEEEDSQENGFSLPAAGLIPLVMVRTLSIFDSCVKLTGRNDENNNNSTYWNRNYLSPSVLRLLTKRRSAPAHSAEKIHKVRIIRTVTNVAKKAELCESTVEIMEANLLLLFGLSCENCRWSFVASFRKPQIALRRYEPE